MPLNPINYLKTVMYRIVCNDVLITDCYVGSTTDYKTRKRRHKCNCHNESKKEYNFNVYKFIRDHGGWSNWSMVPIEEFSCNTKHEAAIRERYWLEYYMASLNSQVPSRTDEQYRFDNADKIKEYNKTYYEKRKNKILNPECLPV